MLSDVERLEIQIIQLENELMQLRKDIFKLNEKVASLEKENFALAANQCPCKDELYYDESGNSYCLFS